MREELIDVQSLQSPHVLRMYASERAAQLRRTAIPARRDAPPREVRRWPGEELVRIGAWIAAEPTVRQAGEGAR